jgi:hypothetical protein
MAPVQLSGLYVSTIAQSQNVKALVHLAMLKKSVDVLAEAAIVAPSA